MKGAYVFSLNGENYIGAFDSREAALSAALEQAAQEADPPTAVYVGQRVMASPETEGHSDLILARMRERAVARQEGAGPQYLRHVNDQQAAELDDALQSALLHWLKKQELMPTRFNIVTVSEHPVPLPHAMATPDDSAELY
jgi:hypothetical protein